MPSGSYPILNRKSKQNSKSNCNNLLTKSILLEYPNTQIILFLPNNIVKEFIERNHYWEDERVAISDK